MKTKSAISVWFFKYLTSLPVLLPLVALVLGYWRPELQDNVQTITQKWGAHQILKMRVGLSSFYAAAYLYWWTLVLLLPISLLWMHRIAKKLKLHEALSATARSNLLAKTWDPSKWTMKNGRLRLVGALLLGVILVFASLLIAKEPSYCSGCETNSLLGFVVVNWLGTHALLMYCYMMCVYIYFWKTIRSNIGEENE